MRNVAETLRARVIVVVAALVVVVDNDASIPRLRSWTTSLFAAHFSFVLFRLHSFIHDDSRLYRAIDDDDDDGERYYY